MSATSTWPTRRVAGRSGIESLVVTVQDLTPLEELERLRAEFLGMVSHELQAPLTSIKASAATVLGAPRALDPTETMQFFRIIDEQADHMRALIGGLLDAARIETGTLPIRVAAAREGVHVEVSVADEGRSIPAERLPHLFRKFARSGPEDRGRGVGSGLELAICKGLVEAHGGRIRAESEGTGPDALHLFTIPVAGEAGPGGSARPAARPGRPRRAGEDDRPRVLVVDDDPTALLYMRVDSRGRRLLRDRDRRARRSARPHRTVSSRPGAAGPAPARDGRHRADAEPARAGRPARHLPVRIRPRRGGRRALELGAADYVVKPFSPTELTARIEAALRRRARTPAPFRMGDLAIHYGERRVSLAGRPVPLTATEYDLLSALSANPGRVSTHDYLLRRVWRSRRAGSTPLVRAFIRSSARSSATMRATRPTSSPSPGSDTAWPGPRQGKETRPVLNMGLDGARLLCVPSHSRLPDEHAWQQPA